MQLILATLLIITLNNWYNPDWEKYTSIVGNFTIQLPGMPLRDQKTTTYEGHQIDFYRFYVSDSKSITYLIGYLDFSEEEFQIIDPEKQLKVSKDRLIQGLQGELKSETTISLDKYPGRLLSFTTSKGQYFKVALYVVNRRLYQLVVSSNKDNFDEKDANKFLNSFKLYEKDFYEFFEGNVGDLPKADETVIRGKATKHPSPDYPDEAVANKIEGDVVVRILLDTNGKVIASRVKSGPLILQESALLAAREWKFKQTLLNNKPVGVLGILTFRFKL